MQRVSFWSLIVVAAAVFVAAGYVVLRQDPVHDAGRPVPVPSSTTGSVGASGNSGGGSQPPVVVAFLGDDWTSGAGASAPDKRFTTLLAGRLGMSERNFGVAGSGYAKSSTSGGAYETRIAALVKAKPRVIVVSGGRNDVDDYGPTLRTRVKSLFATLHAELPNATLIAVAPMWGDSDKPAALTPVTDAVRESVTAAGGQYFAVADPLHTHPGYMSSAADPNDQGYAAIAATLAPRLKPLLSD